MFMTLFDNWANTGINRAFRAFGGKIAPIGDRPQSARKDDTVKVINLKFFPSGNDYDIKPYYRIQGLDFERNYDHNNQQPFNPSIKQFKIAKEDSNFKRELEIDSKLLQIYGNAVELESSLIFGGALQEIEESDFLTKEQAQAKYDKMLKDKQWYDANDDGTEGFMEMYGHLDTDPVIGTAADYFVALIRGYIKGYKEYEQFWVHKTEMVVPKNERSWPEEQQHKIITLRRDTKRRLNAVRNHDGVIPRRVLPTPTASMGTLGKLKIRKEILKDDPTFYLRNRIEEIWNNPEWAAWLQNVPVKMYEDVKAVVEKFYW